MTDKELIKALKICASIGGRCNDCPADKLKTTDRCYNLIAEMAADRLDGLTKGGDGWISVAERLPTESGTYLVNVHQENDYRSSDCVLEAWYWADKPLFCPDSVGWHMLNEFYPYSDTMRDDITHWMPWPEPPEMDE